MTLPQPKQRNKMFTLVGLATSLAVAVFLSPLASQSPDGLDRVAQDLQFEEKAIAEPLTQKLPFYSVFDEYALRGVPAAVATPLAGLIGTLVTFGIAWGMGKVLVRQKQPVAVAEEQKFPDAQN